ncbi:MAG: hypothetical protein Q8S13_07425 [Dehalococcoidia bacterium]|nr:hypothetical protein [Dehalococcoidia bacterium]
MPREKRFPKDEALDAIADVITALRDEKRAVVGLLRFQLAAALDYARERVVSIEALKRARAVPKPPVVPEPTPNGSEASRPGAPGGGTAQEDLPGRSVEAPDGESTTRSAE